MFRGSAFGRNLNRVSLPIGCDPVIVGIIDGVDLANVACQNIQVISICSRRLDHRVVTLVDQDNISVLHRDGHVQVRVPGINALDGKSILPLKTVIVGFLVVGRIIPRIMAMRWKTRPITARRVDFVDGQAFGQFVRIGKRADTSLCICTSANRGGNFIMRNESSRKFSFGRRSAKSDFQGINRFKCVACFGRQVRDVWSVTEKIFSLEFVSLTAKGKRPSSDQWNKDDLFRTCIGFQLLPLAQVDDLK